MTQIADVLAALGAEPRLRILRLLLAAHPDGRSAGELSTALGIAPSTLSHHLERMRRDNLVSVRRQGTFLWYRANTAMLERLLRFLFTECCSRNPVLSAERLISLERSGRSD